MKFYKEFSQYYDYIFPLKQEKLNFLQDNASQTGINLDVATGTGNYALGLAAAGYEVKGIDLSEEMIKQAREKAKKRGMDVEFQTGDMRNTGSIYSGQNVDFLFCIGNSLVHLEDLSEITQVLSHFYNLLNTNGKLVIQIVNYTRILNKEITSLPTINNQQHQIKLTRNYEIKDTKVEFKTKLFTPQGQWPNSVLLYPLTPDELQIALEKVGFSKIIKYGGFNYEDFLPEESFPLVIKATK